MMKLTSIGKLLAVCVVFWGAMPSLALPKYGRTILPFPDHMDDGDQAMAQEVLKLQVYQDHEDPNHYYYVPPFHIRQYTHGAAGLTLHAHNIKQFAAANEEINGRMKYMEEYHQTRLSALEMQIAADRERVNEAMRKLEEAIDGGNARIIELRERFLAREEAVLNRSLGERDNAREIISHGGTLLPLSLRKSYNENIIMKLAQAGVNVPYTGNEDADEMFVKIKTIVQDFASSYGGFMSVNIYGGFTQAQVDALRAYKAKYMPALKVSLLPVETLRFFSLTEWQNDPNAWSFSSKMFRNITGAGDYLGASVVMDTSISGSLGLAEHLQPFVLPVGIKAVFKEVAEPTEAYLDCDFSTGYEVKGRADVRDGLIIYDNDITNTINASDHSRGACNLEYISGDRGSAEFKALESMEKEFERMRLDRTYLAQSEKESYYQSLMADIQNNRRQDEPKHYRVVRSFNERGWTQVVVEAFTKAADFHWHTNIQDMSNLSEVKFSKHIFVQGHEVVERNVPTNLCLVFNRTTNSYDRCTTLEEEQSLQMQKAITQASRSPECATITDPFECGRKRDEARSVERVGDTTPVDDTLLVTAIH